MTEQMTSQQRIDALQQKLESAVNSRSEIESDLQYQGTLLTQFISKLSQSTKGIDVSLDNKFAALRSSISKSISLVELEKQISSITALLKKYNGINERKIAQLQEEFLSLAQSLQKINNIPNQTRRELRLLLNENSQRKETLIDYISPLTQLLQFYKAVLMSNKPQPSSGILQATPVQPKSHNENNEQPTQEAIEQFAAILNKIVLSAKHNKKIQAIKSVLPSVTEKDKLVEQFFAVLNVIVDDLTLERSTAETFLSALNDTLTTVQSAVKSTLSQSKESFDKQDKLNNVLKDQLDSIESQINDTPSLASLKQDINEKLATITAIVETKTKLEKNQQTLLNEQMQEMTTKIALLEEQSKVFEQKLKEQKKQSMQDALTKLPNRAAFDDYFSKEIVKCHHNKTDLAIVVLDLDDFKRINDTYGHTAGDKTLQVIAKTLHKHMTDSLFIARYGGEEFVMVINASQTEVLRKLDSIRKQIALLPFKFKNNKVSITVSVGAHTITEHDNLHTAFEQADTALYKAKTAGKNRIIYT